LDVVKYFRLKETWIAAAIAVMAVIAFSVKSLELLAIPYVVLIIGTLPGMAALSISTSFALTFVFFHRLFCGKKNVRYYFDSQYVDENMHLSRLVGWAAIHSIAMAYLIARVTGFLFHRDIANDPVTMMILMWMSSWFAFALAFGSWLLRRSGYMFENTVDGTRINLGVEMDKALKRSIGIQTIATSIILAGTISQSVSTLMTLALTIAMITVPSTLFSVYFIRKRHSMRMLSNLISRLARFI
jgi:hypothetical protein